MNLNLTMFFRIISFLFFVIFVLNYYTKIPYFYVVYFVITIILIFLRLKELNSFQQQIDNNKFEFYIREYENNLVLKYFFSFFIIGFISMLIYLIPIKTRDLTEIDYIFLFITILITTFINWKKDNYEYYYFGDEFIKKPGLNESKIYWNEVKDVYENEKDELIIVEMHNGSYIKIGTEPYYSFFKNKNEILTYIKNKIK